jgi:hypothetical protein
VPKKQQKVRVLDPAEVAFSHCILAAAKTGAFWGAFAARLK